MPSARTSLLDRARGAIDVLAREVLKFGVVGVVAFFVDITLFNIGRFGLGVLVLHPATGPLHQHPLTAKVVSTSVATLVAWLGNRLWTFRHRRSKAAHHELALFVVFNVVGMVIALACLAFSHYLLDLRSGLADNISGNGVGLVLGTLFRFWAYRRFVFKDSDLQIELPAPPCDLAPAVDVARVANVGTPSATPSGTPHSEPIRAPGVPPMLGDGRLSGPQAGDPSASERNNAKITG